MDLSLLPCIINTVNSVIGVSVLAMPFCFNQCGIFLGVLVLLFVAYMTYLSSCQLLQLAHFHKKRSYEFLAMHVFGALGKLAVEFSMIGLMMGTFVAFFVIIGDLGPEIGHDLFAIQVTPKARALFLVFLGAFVVLPLSLQKNIDNLSSLSAVSLLFYFTFLIHIIYLALQRVFFAKPSSDMVTWNPSGVFKCMPIMSMSFGCQTQLFVVYETLSDPSIKSMKSVIKATLTVTAVVYIGVGLSGYFAFAGAMPIPGDILTMYENTLMVTILKIGFVLSVAISFPLLIFPLRASMYSLIFLRKGPSTDLSGESTVLMPDHRFRIITLFIVFFTLMCGILVPNVEFVLALTGSVTGSVIFFILPASMHVRTFGTSAPGSPVVASASSAPSRRVKFHAHVVLVVGLCVGLVGSLVAVEDQQARTQALRETMAKMEARRAAHELAAGKVVQKPLPLKDKPVLKKPVIPPQKRTNLPDTAGLEERKEPANPDQPVVKVFINSSKSKPVAGHIRTVRHEPPAVFNATTPSVTTTTAQTGGTQRNTRRMATTRVAPAPNKTVPASDGLETTRTGRTTRPAKARTVG